jgi:hypothetical protein
MSDDATTSATADAAAGDESTGAEGSAELTPEQLKAALAAARKEAAGYRTKLREAEPFVTKAKELEDAQKSDVEKLTAAQATEKARADKAEAQLLRVTAAIGAGLDVDMADRLRGATAEELAADAKALAEKFGTTNVSDVRTRPQARLKDGLTPPAGSLDDESPEALAKRVRAKRQY